MPRLATREVSVPETVIGISLTESDLAADAMQAHVDAGLQRIAAEAAAAVEEQPEGSVAPAVLGIMAALWLAYVVDTLLPFLADLLQAARIEQAEAFASALSLDPDLPMFSEPIDTQLYLQNAQNRLVGIGDDLWNNARIALAEGLAAGEAMPKLAARVRDAAGVTQPRARVIARTEAHGARQSVANATTLRVAAESGTPGALRKRWQATEDVRTRPTHHAADGQTVALDEPFQVGLASLDFPGQPGGPAEEVINCRCVSLTIIDVAALRGSFAPSETALTAAADIESEGNAMPWSIVEGDARCDAGEFAVVKDGDNELEGCHTSREGAEAQVTALYASESEGAGRSKRYAAVSGDIVVGDRQTGDRRQFTVEELVWQDVGVSSSLEIPLGHQYERGHGGDGSDKVALVGRLDSIERQGKALFARGVVDISTPEGLAAARRMGTRDEPGTLAGVSVIVDEDPDGPGMSVEYQFAEGCDSSDELTEACMIPERTIIRAGARIRAVDLVDIPAFAEARLYLDEPLPDDVDAADDIEDPVMASAYTMTLPDLPPAEWFNEPTDEPDIGAITVTDDGRIFGYLAPKHVAHRGIRDKRIEVPMGNVDYGVWMNRVTLADDGNGSFTRVATGPITMDCGHASASPQVRGAARREHYDNSCSVVATVRAGENARGVWIAGAVLPDVSPDQIRRMMACQLSGDWGPHREKPGKRELAAALLVPVPGFPKRSHSFVSTERGELAHVGVPLRFAVRTEVAEEMTVFGLQAAADKIAASVGRDRASKIHQMAAQVRERKGV